VSRARWSCLWRRMCGVKTARRGRNNSLITVLSISWYVCSTILFCKLLCKLLCLLYWIWWLLFYFIFRRRIIIGWGRDMGTILWPIRNSIRICEWRLAHQVDPIKIGFTGCPTLRPTTCGRPVVFQPLGAPNQYRAPNLRSLWSCSNTLLSSPRNTITSKRSTHNSERNKERSLSSSKRLKHNKKRSMKRLMNNKKRLMNNFEKWS